MVPFLVTFWLCSRSLRLTIHAGVVRHPPSPSWREINHCVGSIHERKITCTFGRSIMVRLVFILMTLWPCSPCCQLRLMHVHVPAWLGIQRLYLYHDNDLNVCAGPVRRRRIVRTFGYNIVVWPLFLAIPLLCFSMLQLRH